MFDQSKTELSCGRLSGKQNKVMAVKCKESYDHYEDGDDRDDDVGDGEEEP